MAAVILGVAIAGAIAISSGRATSESVTIDGVKVSRAISVLNDVAQRLHQLSADSELVVSDNASCFLHRSSEAAAGQRADTVKDSDVERSAVCGPFLVSGEQTLELKWVDVKLIATVEADRKNASYRLSADLTQATVPTAESFADTRSINVNATIAPTALPASAFRPDGGKPDTKTFAMPDNQAIMLGWAPSLSLHSLAGKGVLHRGGSVLFDSSGIVSTLNDPSARVRVQSKAKSHLVAAIVGRNSRGADQGESIGVVKGNEPVALPSGTSFDSSNDSRLLIVASEDPTQVAVRLDSPSRKVDFNLLTGALGGRDGAASYPARRNGTTSIGLGQFVEKAASPLDSSGDEATLTLNAELSVRTEELDDDGAADTAKGFAPNGSMWLRVTGDATVDDGSSGIFPAPVHTRIDSITASDGDNNDLLLVRAPTAASSAYLFRAPASLTNVKVTVKTTTNQLERCVSGCYDAAVVATEHEAGNALIALK